MFKNKMINLLCVMFLQGCGCYQINRFLQKKIKPISYFGCVEMKFIDTLDRMTPKIKFKNNKIIDMDAYEMYDELQPGDTVIKKAGSLKFILKRNGETKVFYPKCDGKEIK